MTRQAASVGFGHRSDTLMEAARRACRGFAAGMGFIAAVSLPAQATTFVLMDFDGDAAFPNITFGANTAGLAPFTGSAFGLNAASLAAVKSTILTKVADDYAAYDISFVTDTTGLASWFTWGIDDTAYVFPQAYKTAAGQYDPIDPSVPCPAANVDCFRLFGKKGNLPGDTDRAGASIAFPTFARTWAGSFALGAGSADPSSPSLFGATDAEIGQALANSAAHEISHMFGVGHPLNCAQPCFDLMWVETEAFESTRDKSFTAADRAVLLGTLGAANAPEPATLALLALGLAALRMRSSGLRLHRSNGA